MLRLRTKYTLCLLLIFICIISSACRTNSQSETAFERGINRDSITYDSKIIEEGYPREIKQLMSDGTEQTIRYTRAPHRIIAVWQNSIETLLALGVGKDIIAAIGVPDAEYISPEYREAYNQIPYKSMQMPDKESVLYNEPDFILGWYSTFGRSVFGNTAFYQDRQIGTYIAQSSYGRKLNKNHTLSEEYEYILQIGEIVNREERAKQLVQSLEQQVNQGRELGLSQGKKPLALIVELEGKDLRLYNETTLAGNIIEQVGGELLLPQEERTGYEELITLNPDVLFVVIVESEYKNADKIVARLYNNPALQSLTSVKNHSIKTLPLYAVYSPGIRVKDGIQIIVDGLYPELAKEGPHEKLVTGN